MITRQVPSQNLRARRTGTIMPGLLVALVVTIAACALVLDRLWMQAATTELSTAAEAAAFAAARELVRDDLLRVEPDPQTRIEAARQRALEIARQNPVAGQLVQLNLAEDGDVRFGRQVFDEDSQVQRFLETHHQPRTVAVTAHRTRARGNPVALWWRGITGQPTGDAVARAQVSADNHVLGVRPSPGIPVPALPLAVLKTDALGLRLDTWEQQILSRRGADQYRFDPETQSVVEGEDGLPEIRLHSKQTDESATEANVQLVDLNTDLRTDPLLKQFAEGWTVEALAAFDGELTFHPGLVWLTSSAVIDQDHAEGLEQLIGQARICLLYTELEPAGEEGYGKLRAVDFIAGRLMAVEHPGDGQHVLVFQPAVLTTRTAVLASGASDLSPLSADEQKLLENPYVFKLHVTKFQ